MVPFMPHSLDERRGDARDAVVGVVGGHQGHGAGLGALPEAVGIVVAELLLVKTGVRLVAAVLVAIGEEMLHQGRAPPVGGIVALDAFHLGGDHFAHEVRVLAEALLGAAPTGVARKVGVRRPEDQALPGIVLGIESSLIGHHVTDDVGHFPVPGLPHAIGLREGGAVAVLRLRTARPVAELAGVPEIREFGVAAPHDAVDGLGCAGAGDAKTRNALPDDGHDLFIDGHQGHGVIQPLVLGQFRILEGILLCPEISATRQNQAESERKDAFHKGMIHCTLQIYKHSK